MKKTVRDISVKGKTVLARCDFNVPMEGGRITDDVRIRGALPTIKYLIENGGKIVLMSHLGRPKGEPKKEFSLAVVAKRLEELLGQKIGFIQSERVVDEQVKSQIKALKEGEIFLLENTRYRKEETKNEEAFSKELASLGDIFVNDAFGTAHRAHCSTAGIAKFLPAVSGFLIEKEIKYLDEAVNCPERPFVAILGGAKVGDKIPVIKELMKKVDSIIIGGGMGYTFLKAKGFEIGTSLLDEEHIELAKQLMEEGEKKGVKILIPVDSLCTEEFSNDGPVWVYEQGKIPKDIMGLDIGPKTIDLFKEEIEKAKTIVWNGPMGVFEMSTFQRGTEEIAKALAESDAVTIIGGGDSAAAVEKFGLGDRMNHMSTGGGASLEFLEGKILPGVDVLEEK